MGEKKAYFEFGPCKIDLDRTIRFVKQDLKDDWFLDPLRFKDRIEKATIADYFLNNIQENNGVYKPVERLEINIPKQASTLRYSLETCFYDRVAYHAFGEILIRNFDKLLHRRVLNNRLDILSFFNEDKVPIYNLFLRSQITGVGLSQYSLEKKLLELKAMYFSSIKRLELDYGFLSQRIKPHMSWHDIKEHCKLQNIGDEIDYNFWDLIEIYAEYDEFLQLLLGARNSYVDYSALLKYCVSAYRKVYAQFDVMGTVTGRILIRRPGIQYLKKTSRDIFSPADGNIFLYADFDQFEPGIIASFSKDRKLIDLYNTGDIYEGLSQLLFGTVERRKVAKVIFLSFIYGMSQERLGKLILDTTGQEEMRERGLLFFREFEVLNNWKQRVCDEAAACGYVSSYMGNRRYLAEKGQITSKERRWVPNQIIQGTASYIFKKSLVELKRRIEEVQLLVPMHDAILLEVRGDMEDEVKSAVQYLFNGTFKAVCPDIEPSVSFEPFAA